MRRTITVALVVGTLLTLIVDQPLDSPPAREPGAADHDGPSRVDAFR